jgi:hypothetical protein
MNLQIRVERKMKGKQHLHESGVDVLSITHKFGEPGPLLTEQIRPQARYFAERPDEQ